MEILEGKQCIVPALQTRQRKFRLILIKQGINPARIEDILAVAEEQAIPVKYVAAEEIDALTKGRSHGGLAAICTPKPKFEIDKLIELCRKLSEPAFLLLIEGTEDAQNLGYTLRSAEALGAHAVLLKKHVWNFDAAAVSRASSGAFERMPLVQIEHAEKELLPLQRLGIKIYGCIGGAKRTIYEVDLTGPVMLAIGGERRGLSGAVREMCNGFIRIPMAVGATSLALSHAAAVVMAEVMRQRRQSKAAEQRA
ncbi:MAG: RNA methyltransferase [candidate division KSB1 bacterium]|nr:RNA methyltransferase [candidate division KSB1 bacterium]MDZ7305357.1 RNA methyltransferase [candidate division KSB1 bacterium]MDZ7314449.1 RNA methyltransferase [candidate division KSB1 bacterium]